MVETRFKVQRAEDSLLLLLELLNLPEPEEDDQIFIAESLNELIEKMSRCSLPRSDRSILLETETEKNNFFDESFRTIDRRDIIDLLAAVLTFTVQRFDQLLDQKSELLNNN